MDGYDDPRFDPSLGRWVTYNADQGAVWEPYALVPQAGQYVTYNADAGGQFERFNEQQKAAIAQQIGAEQQAAIQRAAEYLAANPLAMSGNMIQTRSGDLRDVSYFNPIVKPGENVTGSTLTQLVDPVTKDPVFLSDPNNPYSYTYTDTGIPAIGGTLEQQAAMYNPIQDKGVFGTLGGDLLSAVKDPYFRNFAIAAATMAAAAALAPAAGAGGLGSASTGATAFPIDFSSAISTGGLGGAGGVSGSTAGGFLGGAGDILAGAAGTGGGSLGGAAGVTGSTAGGFLGGSGDILAGATGTGGGSLGGTASTLGALGATEAGSTAGGFLGGAGDIAAGAAGTGGGALGGSTIGGLLTSAGDLLAGPYGGLIKGGLVLGGMAVADALKPKEEEGSVGSGLSAEELKALVASMPSMIDQYVANAQNIPSGTGANYTGYNPGTAQALADLFPTFALPTTGTFYGAGRFGEGYAPNAPIVKV